MKLGTGAYKLREGNPDQKAVGSAFVRFIAERLEIAKVPQKTVPATVVAVQGFRKRVLADVN
jgi:hypothetical protein